MLEIYYIKKNKKRWIAKFNQSIEPNHNIFTRTSSTINYFLQINYYLTINIVISYLIIIFINMM